MRMIDFDDIKNIFINDLSGYNDAYRQVSPHHPLDLMLGSTQNFNSALLLNTKNRPEVIPNSSMINISVGERADGKYSIIFSLLSDKYIDLFCYFCLDMINSSVNCTAENDADFLCNRYLLWKRMLEKTKNTLLSENETKGLIGELFFLKEYLSKKHGIKDSIAYWTGPLKTDQDFITENTWYEIKSTSPGATAIKISSIEQLETYNDGNLVVLFFDKTSIKDNNRLNLNQLVKEIKDEIDDEITEMRFDEIMISSGYVYNDAYNNRNYHFVKANMYNVTKDFPCLRQKNLTSAIGKVTYELTLNRIEEWGVPNGFTGI